jgi:hypothetical protein
MVEPDVRRELHIHPLERFDLPPPNREQAEIESENVVRGAQEDRRGQQREHHHLALTQRQFEELPDRFASITSRHSDVLPL